MAHNFLTFFFLLLYLHVLNDVGDFFKYCVENGNGYVSDKQQQPLPVGFHSPTISQSIETELNLAIYTFWV